MTFLKKLALFYPIVFASAMAGLLLGSLYGGNFATEFQFAGVAGYEAAGVLGFWLVATLASLVLARRFGEIQSSSRRISSIVFGLLGGVVAILLHASVLSLPVAGWAALFFLLLPLLGALLPVSQRKN